MTRGMPKGGVGNPTGINRNPFKGMGCTAGGCTAPIEHTVFCGRHYAANRKYGSPYSNFKPQRRKNAQRERCSWPEDCFSIERHAGLCSSHGARKHLLAKHGLTPEAFVEMERSQGGVCFSCKRPPGKRSLNIDHDHACCPGTHSCGACIRGLFCESCNTMMGRMEAMEEDVLWCLMEIAFSSKERRKAA